MAEAILRLPTVKQRTGISKSEIYRRESIGEFPRRVSLGARAVGWLEGEVDAWIKSRVRQTRTGMTNADKPEAAAQ